MPLKTVQDMQIEEYQDLFKDFFIFPDKITFSFGAHPSSLSFL